MSQRGFALILILLSIVIVVSLVAGVYYLTTQTKDSNYQMSPVESSINVAVSPSPIETAALSSTLNWEIYTDKTLDIQFNYPQILKISELDRMNYFTKEASRIDLSNYDQQT